MEPWGIEQGDCLAVLKTVPSDSVQCCVTSPPYWGLRDYGVDGQIGLEETPAAYVARIVAVFEEVRRVLKPDGTLWLNLGDSYAMSTKGSSGKGAKQQSNAGTLLEDRSWAIPSGLKAKDLVGIPWSVAFALRAAGWYLRADIIWHKPNPMPESVRDRPTKAHEYLFLLAKSERYYYDADALKEPAKYAGKILDYTGDQKANKADARQATLPQGRLITVPEKRNRRSVWTVTPRPFRGAHFATMPPDLVEPCVLAGSRPGDIVIDPFAGAGTTGLVAIQHKRLFYGIELNPEYIKIASARLRGEAIEAA